MKTKIIVSLIAIILLANCITPLALISYADETFSLDVNYSITTPTNQDVIVTITSNRDVQGVEGWTLSENRKELTKTYVKNTSESGESILVKDLEENEKTVNVLIRNINKEELIVFVTYTDNEDGSVTALITGNKELELIEGWEYSNNKKVLVKTYRENTGETGEEIIVKDSFGNEVTATVLIKTVNIGMSGDVNENAKIDIGDILLLQRYVARNNSQNVAGKHLDWVLSQKQISIGDTNKNNQIDIGDILILQRYMAAKNNKNVEQQHEEWIKALENN